MSTVESTLWRHLWTQTTKFYFRKLLQRVNGRRIRDIGPVSTKIWYSKNRDCRFYLQAPISQLKMPESRIGTRVLIEKRFREKASCFFGFRDAKNGLISTFSKYAKITTQFITMLLISKSFGRRALKTGNNSVITTQFGKIEIRPFLASLNPKNQKTFSRIFFSMGTERGILDSGIFSWDMGAWR